MSIDLLQEKIRKLKNPAVVDFFVLPEHIPPHLKENADPVAAYVRFCRELMEGLKELVGVVRFSFSQLALVGGLDALKELTDFANDLGYYVILDAPEVLTPWAADRVADAFFGAENRYYCDALVLSPYIGSDAIKPFVSYCKDFQKTVFLAVRTPNKSASEIQDLLAGSRHVHVAAMELVSRYGDGITGKTGYSQMGALVSATNGASVTQLRAKYKQSFLLVDGYDYPGGNGKNAGLAFDRMGWGAAVCAGPSITAAWYEAETDGTDFVEQARQAAQRMKKILSRYVTIL